MGDDQALKPRLNSVEIKVTLAQGAMERALNKLGLDPRECITRRIFFCESQAGLELLERKIILRLRETPGKGDDSTVKLRPFDARKLSTDWRDKNEVDGGKFRIEGDWAGERRVVAASVVVNQQQGEVARAATGNRPIGKLFSDEQEDFLRKHTPKPVDLSALRMLGPINARKWEPSEDGFPRALAAEHWKVDELEFLELSVREDDPKRGAKVQAELDDFLEKLGLLGDVVTDMKTRTVLEHLVNSGGS